MATSGSVDFSVSRDNLIEDAIRLVGGLGPEDSASTAQKTHGARVLNMIAKSWMGDGIGLWARKTGYVLPQTDTFTIDIGPTGDHVTASYVHTTLAAASSSTSLNVASITGILDLDQIGIETPTGMQWTTVSGTPAGAIVTVATSVTADSGAHVYAYTTKLQRPVKVVDAYLRTISSGQEQELKVLAKADFEALSNKEDASVPNQVAYDPQLIDGTLYVNPQFRDGDSIIKIVFQRPFEDFDAAADTPDFPQEAYLALMYALGVVLAPTYGMPQAERTLLRQEAKEAYGIFRMNEPEEGSMSFQPDMQR